MSKFLDLPLSKLLAKIASSQGYAIPVHRFGMMSQSKSGASLIGMSQTSKILEMWQTAIPDGSAALLTHKPQRQDLPLFWISKDEKEIKTIQEALPYFIDQLKINLLSLYSARHLSALQNVNLERSEFSPFFYKLTFQKNLFQISNNFIT